MTCVFSLLDNLHSTAAFDRRLWKFQSETLGGGVGSASREEASSRDFRRGSTTARSESAGAEGLEGGMFAVSMRKKDGRRGVESQKTQAGACPPKLMKSYHITCIKGHETHLP